MKICEEEGFSLLEVLVALAIFGVLLGGLSVMMERENLLIKNSAEVLQARLIANETMEILKTRPFEELQSYSFPHASERKNMIVNVIVSDFGSSTLKKIAVTVKWSDLQGLEKTFALSTLRTQYSLSEAKGAVLQETEEPVVREAEEPVPSGVEGGGGQ